MSVVQRRTQNLVPKRRRGREHAGANGGFVQQGGHDRIDDGDLAHAIAQRDHAALAFAYRRYGSRVHAVAKGLCGDPRAEELTQDVFLRLWNDPQRFDATRGSLLSYLLMQAHGKAVDVLRSDKHRTAREVVHQALELQPQNPGTEALALALLERAGISARVAALPVSERQPIVLAYFGGHTYRDVARLLAVPEGTIKSRIRSGLKRLRTESGQPPSGLR